MTVILCITAFGLGVVIGMGICILIGTGGTHG